MSIIEALSSNESLAQFGLTSSPESINPLSLGVEIITPEKFTSRLLTTFREIVYAQYRHDKKPAPVISAKPEDGTSAFYVVATNPDLQLHFDPTIHTSCPDYLTQDLIQAFTRQFRNIAGFYRIEFGYPHQIEASALMTWSGWDDDPNTVYGYISQLSHNQLLPHEAKMEVTRQIHHRGCQLASQINGGINTIIAIMAPHVRGHVNNAQIPSSLMTGGQLRWFDEHGNLTHVAQEIFTEFPYYWGKPDTPTKNQPALWQILPFSLGD